MGTPIEFPPGVPGERRYVQPLYDELWTDRTERGRMFRRAITFDSPVRFALTYLSRHITDEDTGVIAFSEAHLELASIGLRWIERAPARDAVVLPRGGAKSTWLLLILPLWALAHGHRKFAMALAWTKDQAEGHLASLRTELAENRRLLADFPELRRKRSPGASDTKATVTTSGATLMARGLRGSTLGTKTNERRPDLILGDDLEPDPAKHTPGAKETIESLVVNSLLPMGGRNTAVVLSGTTTMVGCLMHDVVRAALPADDRDHRVAPWVSGHGFRTHYWPAILDEGTPAERSVWPHRWSLEWLLEHRENNPQDYALNYANRPERTGERGWWTQNLIRYNPRRAIVRRILSVDGAVTRKARSDRTALVMVGVTADGRTVVEYAEAGRWDTAELLERMWKLTAAMPETVREWVVEQNQGGEKWDELLSPRPEGVEFTLEPVSGSKRSRIEQALRHYQRRAVEHAHPLPQLEDQQQAWTPTATADDLLDALAGALRKAYGQTMGRENAA